MPEWTLESMQRFVLTHQVDVPCPSCRGSLRNGRIIFRACLVIYPEFNDITMHTDACVGCDVMLDRFTCGCRGVTPEELMGARKEAHVLLMKDLERFLYPAAPPPVENTERAEDIRFVKVY